ncbi:uncharacterized protein P174DRAFT_444186 [Aspergillus novofumigatus IBT 16806]|uniref:Uncharacterized protein n=1 Tax=Aspergillus novofumigatus (strain IBT 16806) TaxID=1392255 RepID=A0A2I1C3J1_ASPN1|nr:uncharacterized protein P174DRAFT_444186 [Aspergillus novofumigatus IBT 16806]PKX92151.1 hypothetical protein P174DRAFT_444186 [Aspergillus novofumigatus IBT 16806]
MIFLLCCFWALVCWVWLFDFTLFESFLSLDNGQAFFNLSPSSLLIKFPCYPTTASGVVPTGFRHSYWSRDIAGESTAPQVRAMIFGCYHYYSDLISCYSFPSLSWIF